MFKKNGNKLKIKRKSVVLKIKKINTIEKKKITSEIRFIIIAFKAALLANIRVNQKLINKYELKPTPSQPKNNWTILSDVTKKIIKKVNKDK